MDIKSLHIIAKVKFGSHLYGTNTEFSDTDYKGIYLPTESQITKSLFNKTNLDVINNDSKKGYATKNTKDDIDEEYYALHYFLDLACKGDTFTIDMLHANKENIKKDSSIYRFLRENRSKFYTKNLACYVGYVRKQAHKYSIKGSRLNELRITLNILRNHKDKKVGDILHLIPTDLRFVLIGETTIKETGRVLRTLEVLSKTYQETSSTTYMLESLEKYYESYGVRAEMAMRNEGVDWKAVSHAFRASLQLEEIFKTGDLKFPLKDAEYLKQIKLENFHFVNDKIGEKLEEMVDNIEEMVKTSKLPDQVDRSFFEAYLMDVSRWGRKK